MEDEQDKRRHALNNYLRELQSTRPTLNTAAQSAQAHDELLQTETLAPPGARLRRILDYTSERYIQDEPKQKMNESFTLVGNKNQNSSKNPLDLSKNQPTDTRLQPQETKNDIDPLVRPHMIQKPKTSSPFLIDDIMNKKHKSSASSSIPSKLQGQSYEMEINASSGSSSQTNLTNDSFEILQCQPDRRTPLSMKKAASNAAEFLHLGTDENNDKKGKTNNIHCIYSPIPNDPEGLKLKAFLNQRKQQMNLEIEPIIVSQLSTESNNSANHEIPDIHYYHLQNKICKDCKNSAQTKLEKIDTKLISENSKTTHEIKNSKDMPLEIFKSSSLQKISNNDSQEISKEKENWQHANYKSKSSNNDTAKDIKLESQEQSLELQYPTLHSILNEKTTYEKEKINKPWNNDYISKQRSMTNIQGPLYNSPISFSPCNLDGTSGIFHGTNMQQDSEVPRSLLNNEQPYMKEKIIPSTDGRMKSSSAGPRIINNAQEGMIKENIQPQDKLIKSSSTRPKQQGEAIKNFDRFYSFREGQIPYTALFLSFAPPSDTAMLKSEAKPATFNVKASRMGANAAAAQTILTMIAQKPPSKKEYRQQRRDSRTLSIQTGIPDLIRPWRPKLKTAQPIISLRNKSNNEQWHPISFDNQLNEDNNTDTTETAHSTDSSDHFQNFNMDDYENDIRSNVDKEVDRIQDFNDGILRRNGCQLIPYQLVQENLPQDLYIGSFMAQLSNKTVCIFVCKPCDMAGFVKANFIKHHGSDKHQDNVKVWIAQHYFLPMAQNIIPNTNIEQGTSWKKPTPFQQFSKLKEKIRASSFPSKYSQEVLGLITEFFDYKEILEVKFTQDFEEARNQDGQMHWIIEGFNYLKSKEDPRTFMKDKFINDELNLIEKTPLQLSEVKYLSDLARLLFVLFINCDFIPTDYIIMLATVMNQQQTLKYPESSTGLFNAQYLDLFLNFGAMQLSYRNDIQDSKDQFELSELLLEANLSANNEEIDLPESPQEEPPSIKSSKQWSPKEEPTINTGSKRWSWQPNTYQTPRFDTQECIAGIEGTTAEDLILHGPLTADLQMRKITENSIRKNDTILDQDSPMEHDQEWKERSVDYDHEWKERSKDCNPTGTDKEEQSATTTSTCSIPSLESTFNDHRYNHPIASPIPSTSTAITDGSSRSKESIPSNNSFQSKDSFKSPHRKDAIYISNLIKGMRKYHIAKMCKDYGSIKSIVKKKHPETAAAVLFYKKSSARMAIKELNGKVLSLYYPPIANHQDKQDTRIKVQYALRNGLITYVSPKTKMPPPNLPKLAQHPKKEQSKDGLTEFNDASFLISAMHNNIIHKHSNKDIIVKLFNKIHPEKIIRQATVSLTCGLSPRLQVQDGIYDVTNSTTIISIRNNADFSLHIKKHQLIKGAQCHLQDYVNQNTIDKNVCMPAYHLQCKTFKLMNQFQDDIQTLSDSKITENKKVIDCNKWNMQSDPE